MNTTNQNTVTINNKEFAVTYNPLWWHKRGLTKTASGYGKKLPTANCVQYEGRLRRIYCTIYSNSGTCFVVVNGEEVTVR